MHVVLKLYSYFMVFHSNILPVHGDFPTDPGRKPGKMRKDTVAPFLKYVKVNDTERLKATKSLKLKR